MCVGLVSAGELTASRLTSFCREGRSSVRPSLFVDPPCLARKVWLLRLPSAEASRLPAAVRAYVRFGEKKGWHEGYKCRIRKHWWVVPSFWVPDAFLLRQVHLFPRMISNHGEATCMDTIHRLRVRNRVRADGLAASFVNSMSLAFSEVLGRSYGGGVLELGAEGGREDSVPYQAGDVLELGRLDSLLRIGDVGKVLDETDRALISALVGLAPEEVRALRGVWETLSSRRLGRKRRTTTR